MFPAIRSPFDKHPQIYLFRHGLLEDDDKKRFIGRTDVSLSSNGRGQAEKWRPFFLKVGVEQILTSDLKRTKQFARKLFGQEEILNIRPELSEIDLGQWEGMARIEVKQRFPHEYQERGRDLANYRPPGGESFADLAYRVQPIIDEFRCHSGNILVVVGHAGVNRVILARILDMPLGNVMRLGQDYGCLNIIERDGRCLKIRSINQPAP